MSRKIFSQLKAKKLHPPLCYGLGYGLGYPPGRDHVLEGRRSQGGLTPNSLEFDLLGAFRC